MALYSPFAFDGSITLGKLGQGFHRFFFLSPHTLICFFVCAKSVLFFPRQDGIFTLTLTGMMALDEARGIRGITL